MIELFAGKTNKRNYVPRVDNIADKIYIEYIQDIRQ